MNHIIFEVMFFICIIYYLDLLIAFIIPTATQETIPPKTEIAQETKYPAK